MFKKTWSKNGEAVTSNSEAVLLITDLYKDIMDKLGDDYKEYELKFSLKRRNITKDAWIKSELIVEYDKGQIYNMYDYQIESNTILEIKRTIDLLDMRDGEFYSFSYVVEIVYYL